jgi:ssRNA-specific RNase YbeY (16S rRNA maturation enzyme)
MKKQKTALNFFNFNSKFEADLKKCALSVLKSEKIPAYTINIVLISDKEIKKMSKEYLAANHIT